MAKFACGSTAKKCQEGTSVNLLVAIFAWKRKARRLIFGISASANYLDDFVVVTALFETMALVSCVARMFCHPHYLSTGALAQRGFSDGGPTVVVSAFNGSIAQ